MASTKDSGAKPTGGYINKIASQLKNVSSRSFLEKEMKCILCHGEDINLSEVREELKIGNDIIYTPIRIPVCHSCGERYYDRHTVRYLEEVEQALTAGKATLHEVGKVMELTEL